MNVIDRNSAERGVASDLNQETIDALLKPMLECITEQIKECMRRFIAGLPLSDMCGRDDLLPDRFYIVNGKETQVEVLETFSDEDNDFVLRESSKIVPLIRRMLFPGWKPGEPFNEIGNKVRLTKGLDGEKLKCPLGLVPVQYEYDRSRSDNLLTSWRNISEFKAALSQPDIQRDVRGKLFNLMDLVVRRTFPPGHLNLGPGQGFSVTVRDMEQYQNSEGLRPHIDLPRNISDVMVSFARQSNLTTEVYKPESPTEHWPIMTSGSRGTGVFVEECSQGRGINPGIKNLVRVDLFEGGVHSAPIQPTDPSRERVYINVAVKLGSEGHKSKVLADVDIRDKVPQELVDLERKYRCLRSVRGNPILTAACNEYNRDVSAEEEEMYRLLMGEEEVKQDAGGSFPTKADQQEGWLIPVVHEYGVTAASSAATTFMVLGTRDLLLNRDYTLEEAETGAFLVNKGIMLIRLGHAMWQGASVIAAIAAMIINALVSYCVSFTLNRTGFVSEHTARRFSDIASIGVTVGLGGNWKHIAVSMAASSVAAYVEGVAAKRFLPQRSSPEKRKVN